MSGIRLPKLTRLTAAMARNTVSWTAPFVRFIPTDRCNLDCAYCFQKSDDPRVMRFEEFEAYLRKARRLGIGLASFLGGEPLTWEPIVDAVASCTRHGVFSDITTNGTLLDEAMLGRLGEAGLDLLNVSVDVLRAGRVTSKSALFRADRLEMFAEARHRHGIRVRINSVLFKDNSAEIRELVEVAHRHGLPISVGFVVPHFGPENVPDFCFTMDDRPLLEEMIAFLVERKDRGYRIIDTRDYFRNVYRYLNRERFWECNYQRRFGWLNVTPSGYVRSCTKKMDELDVPFLELTPRRIKELRRGFARDIEACNVDCYSNCAYDGYYFFRNMPAAIGRYLSGLSRRHLPARA